MGDDDPTTPSTPGRAGPDTTDSGPASPPPARDGGDDPGTSAEQVVTAAALELDTLRVAHGMQPLCGSWAEVNGSPDSPPAS